MRTFKVTVGYDGTAYAGWQLQLNQPTVQGAFEAALAKIVGREVRVTASGRTDAGVHALGQVVSFDCETELPADVLKNALNANTPRDIAVLAVEDAPAGFHATGDAVRKRYRYVIHDGPTPDIFRRAYCWLYRERLDVAAMQRAALPLLGTHDFRSFETHWPSRTSSVRTVYALEVRRGEGAEADLITIDVEADGFLYNMVRAIAGTLVEVGRAKRPPSWPAGVLAAGDRKLAGMTAPPQGLFLVRVDFKSAEDPR